MESSKVFLGTRISSDGTVVDSPSRLVITSYPSRLPAEILERCP